MCWEGWQLMRYFHLWRMMKVRGQILLPHIMMRKNLKVVLCRRSCSGQEDLLQNQPNLPGQHAGSGYCCHSDPVLAALSSRRRHCLLDPVRPAEDKQLFELQLMCLYLPAAAGWAVLDGSGWFWTHAAGSSTQLQLSSTRSRLIPVLHKT